MTGEDSVAFLRKVAQNKLIGPGYLWLLTDSSTKITEPTFQLQRDIDLDLAHALNGVGILTLYGEPYQLYQTSREEFRNSSEQQQAYLRQHSYSAGWDNYSFSTGDTSSDMYNYLHYDGMMALGIAACEVSKDIYTGEDLYAQLVQTEFDGVSGKVSFDPITGNRQNDNLIYRVQNFLLSDERSTKDEIRFSADVSVLIHLNNNRNGRVEYVKPFVYADNTTNIPLSLPPLHEDLNLIPVGVRTTGLTLGGIVFLASVMWIVWTFRYRKKEVVRAAQPFFLIQLGVGTLILSLTVVPMSMQEPLPTQALNRSCMATPWLLCIGFVTTVSALFSKTWRLNKLFRDGARCKHIQVRPRDVMLPILLLMPINLLVLICWTVIAPLRWVRTPLENFDQFGRSQSSYGACKGDQPATTALAVTALVFNLALLVFFTFQAYKARSIPTAFSESVFITVSLVSLVEISFLFIPLLYIGTTSPTVLFIVRCILVSSSCLAVQLPMFVPKLFRRDQQVQVPFFQDFTQLERFGSAGTRNNLFVSGLNMQDPIRNSPNRSLSRDEDELIAPSHKWGVLRVKRKAQHHDQSNSLVLNGNR